ncbi:hypothetical protein CBOM_05091 [Ceraceosorus bombacis]|uniref:Uncharacterized protein n=1 Tax=Ceraceosorus bombacis TaxID=401625 RepID=A0A0P1BHY1_9BASI|nr:hypothetical protein CBOM_05091 [Ceraceosorus bombacis]
MGLPEPTTQRHIPKHGPSLQGTNVKAGNDGAAGQESGPFMKVTSQGGLYGPNGYRLFQAMDVIKPPPEMDIRTFQTFWMDHCFQLTPHGGGMVMLDYCGWPSTMAHYVSVTCVRFGAERRSYTHELINDYTTGFGGAFTRPDKGEIAECLNRDKDKIRWANDLTPPDQPAR